MEKLHLILPVLWGETEESETQTGAVTTLKPHRNILYVKIKAVGNVKLITLEYILYVFMYNSYICKPLMQLSKYG